MSNERPIRDVPESVGFNQEVQALDLFSNGSSGFYFDDINVEVAPPPAPQIIRGDFNGDGILDNYLTEGLFGLSAGFIVGSSQPPCLASADANGDGTINFLTDSIYILAAGFIPNTPPPPAPWPGCGEDPGMLPCDTAPPGCNP